MTIKSYLGKDLEERLNNHNQCSLSLTVAIMALFIPYVTIYLFEEYHWSIIYFEGIPAVIAILLMFKWGNFTNDELYLRRNKISKVGIFFVIAALIIFSIINVFGERGEINFLAIFIIAPLSGITQELYFRCSLQVALEQHYSFRTANILQTIFFIWWHLRLFLNYLQPIAWIGLIIGLGFYGLAWGYQSRQDGTILYVMILHVFGLIAQSLFVWNISL